MTLDVLLVAAVVGTGTIGGVLFAFSSFVMPALARLGSQAGVEAMQSVNVTAVRPSFMVVFVGTALLVVAASVLALGEDGPTVALVVSGAALYLVGVVGLTGAYHVPLNNRLGAPSPQDAVDSGLWSQYLQRWTGANHVRTAAALVACGLLAVAVGR